MQLKDLFDMWGESTITLLTMATNGLSPTKDRILAVSFTDYSIPSLETTKYPLFNMTTGMELQQSSTYHGISIEDMLDHGVEEDTFKEQVEEILSEDRLIFTYNVQFHMAFLQELFPDKEDICLYDLSVIEKAIRNKAPLSSEDLAAFVPFYDACQSFTVPMPVASICRHLQMSRDPAPGQLPMERMQQVLQQLLYEAFSADIVVPKS